MQQVLFTGIDADP